MSTERSARVLDINQVKRPRSYPLQCLGQFFGRVTLFHRLEPADWLWATRIARSHGPLEHFQLRGRRLGLLWSSLPPTLADPIAQQKGQHEHREEQRLGHYLRLLTTPARMGYSDPSKIWAIILSFPGERRSAIRATPFSSYNVMV
jgi:hypothetical protein